MGVGGRESTGTDTTAAVAKARARRVSSVAMPARAQAMRQLAVHAAIFLATRPFSATVGMTLCSF